MQVHLFRSFNSPCPESLLNSRDASAHCTSPRCCCPDLCLLHGPRCSCWPARPSRWRSGSWWSKPHWPLTEPWVRQVDALRLHLEEWFQQESHVLSLVIMCGKRWAREESRGGWGREMTGVLWSLFSKWWEHSRTDSSAGFTPAWAHWEPLAGAL